mmetsp:Transcript_8330/g.15727  ORF Transcript_8330/g.15727 Transcript_8330/m.15727 type:complete len:231 (-) Transcript_8330:631-1323(-)
MYLPNAASIASEISPTVALALAARTASPRRFRLSRFSGSSQDGGGAPGVALCRDTCSIAASSSLTSSSLRVCFKLSNRAIWDSRTFVLSIARTSTRSSFSNLYLLTPTMTSLPESIRACLRAAASSMRNFGMPESTALAIPPSSSTSAMISFALATKSSVKASIMYDPPNGSTTLGMKASSCRISCVLRAMRDENSVGSPIASSKEFVCRLWVPPRVAARASTVVRTTLL